MKRVFSITLTRGGNVGYLYGRPSQVSFEVVAGTAEAAIAKARGQAKRETGWHASWIVEELKHRGAAV